MHHHHDFCTSIALHTPVGVIPLKLEPITSCCGLSFDLWIMVPASKAKEIAKEVLPLKFCVFWQQLSLFSAQVIDHDERYHNQ